MTTDDHDHANCDDARHTLYEFLDGELTPDTQQRIRVYLEACGPCFEAFDFEAELKLVVGKKCCEELPAGLTDKILSVLQNDDGTQVTF